MNEEVFPLIPLDGYPETYNYYIPTEMGRESFQFFRRDQKLFLHSERNIWRKKGLN